MKFLIILLALILCGCGKSYRAYVANTTDEYTTALLNEAQIDIDTGTQEPTTHDESGFKITVIAADIPGLLGLASTKRGKGDCLVRLSPIMIARHDKDEIKSVILHEIGHCFGLRHVDDKRDIMNSGYYKPDWSYALPKYIADLKARIASLRNGTDV